MPDPIWNVLITAEYQYSGGTAFDAAVQVIEALHDSGPIWPVAVRVEVGRDA